MHTIHLAGKTDPGMINIIMNAGRTAETCDAGRKNTCLDFSLKSYEKNDKTDLGSGPKHQ
jgi:hypothetical protein